MFEQKTEYMIWLRPQNSIKRFLLLVTRAYCINQALTPLARKFVLKLLDFKN